MDATVIPTPETEPPSAEPADFESLLAPVVERAYGTALRLSGNRDDAQDLVQEAALLAFRGFGGFRPGTNFRAWFFRILVNCFYASQRKRRPEQSLDALEEELPLVHLFVQSRAAGMHGPGRDPAHEVLDRIAAEDVERAVQSLPEEFRVACTLYFMEDFSYQEIADVSGIPVGTVRSRLHRGRKLLQKRLWQAALDAGGWVQVDAAGGGRQGLQLGSLPLYRNHPLSGIGSWRQPSRGFFQGGNGRPISFRLQQRAPPGGEPLVLSSRLLQITLRR